MNAQDRKPTRRQLDALRILAAKPDVEWTGRAFAAHFWPDKQWMTGGSRYDARARCGGSYLTRLCKAGFAANYYSYHQGTFAYRITEKGKTALRRLAGKDEQ